ncbi:trypsin-7-like [Belonocnema kinseyi]|uniref:trypsin-7-like n=1 Tax=Belonocnema kinseyi TaxID=2817044 RepID=UPI00143CCA8C|nr:trypsin-7-like [Belonocnema kinseyi]
MSIFIFTLLIFFAFIVILNSVEVSVHLNIGNKKDIVGGNQTDVKKVPYIASITHGGNYICGAVIIDQYWIITAEHCLDFETGYTVRTGTSFKNSGGEEYKVEKLIKFPPSKKISGQEDTGYDDDFALLKLEKPINLKNTQKPIPLAKPGDTLEVGRKIQVSGFGATNENGEASTVLRTAFVPIIDQNECKKLYSYDPPSDRSFCAGYVKSGGIDSCFGDSGGPAVLDGKLVGIVIGGAGCARPGSPGVYMRVSAFNSWVAQTTGLSNI